GPGTDRFEVELADDLTLTAGSVIGFEEFHKLGAGTLTASGSHSYGSTTIGSGALTVDVFETSTLTMGAGARLNLNGTLQAPGGAPTAISGAGGAETITGAPASVLRATGTLGGGADLV